MLESTSSKAVTSAGQYELVTIDASARLTVIDRHNKFAATQSQVKL